MIKKSNIIQLETPRLLLLPLSHQQLLLYIKNDHSLEADLGLLPQQRDISPDLQEALELAILPSVANPAKNALFYTLWTIILKEKQGMVGDLCFKGAPDEKGEVEIGYGTYLEHRGNGYMTEAVGAMIEWAFAQKGVKVITAETEKDNLASHRILVKNNFIQVKKESDRFCWRLKKWKK